MAYITNADVEARLGHTLYVQLTDDAGTGTADEGIVDEARLAAEGEVNSHLARRYRVPVDLVAHPEVAGVLKSVTLDLATYRLYLRRPPAPEGAKGQRDAVMTWLAQLAEGRVVLPAAAELVCPLTAGILGQAVGAERALSREELRDL